MTDRVVAPVIEHGVRDAEVASWVRDMHQHFAQYGSYRAVDIARVLGDQNAFVQSGSVVNEKVATWFNLCGR
jgi:hypothetical protein